MLRILPTISGYRDKRTQRVIFTTPYSEALEDLATDLETMETEIDALLDSIANLKYQALNQPSEEGSIIPEISALTEEAKELASEKDRLTRGVKDFGILIPVEEIASISLFHADIQADYFTPLENS